MDPTQPTTAAPPSPAILDIEPETGAGFPAVQVGPRPVPTPDEPPPAGQTLAVQRVIVRYSEQVDQLFAALAEAQTADDYGEIEKTKTAHVESRRTNTTYDYDYETLGDVIRATRPHLAKVGVVVIQFPFPGATSMTIRTMLTHKSGQWLYNDLSAVIPMPDPQGVGGAISYLRRYAMKAILNVAAEDEDDDAVHASGRAPRQQQRGDPPKPTPRKSQQEVRPAADAKAPVPIGVVSALNEKRDGDAVVAVVAVLDSGFQCATKDPELMAALRARHADRRRVELTTRASSDPARFAPVLEEMSLVEPTVETVARP